MDKKATGPAHSPGEWTPTPASSHRDCTPEDQAQTQDSVQPLDHIHGGQRATSPPPGALEKAMDPSLGSRPDTPTASSTSCLSRSSTLNSFSTTESQESINTLYSLISSFTDETVSVSRSLTLPAMGSYPVDRKSLPKGASIRLFDLPKLPSERSGYPYPSGTSVQTNQAGSGRINRYTTWPDRQNIETPAHDKQVLPSRHLTFPIEKSKDPTELAGSPYFVFEGSEGRRIPVSSRRHSPFLQGATTLSTEMCYNLFKQESPLDEAEFYRLQERNGMSVNPHGGRLGTSNDWMIGSLHSKHDGVHSELAHSPPTEWPSQRHTCRQASRNVSIIHGSKAAERSKGVVSQHHRSDLKRPCSPDSAMFSTTSTIITPGAAVAPEHTRRKESWIQEEEVHESRSSSPGPQNRSRRERNR